MEFRVLVCRAASWHVHDVSTLSPFLAYDRRGAVDRVAHGTTAAGARRATRPTRILVGTASQPAVRRTKSRSAMVAIFLKPRAAWTAQASQIGPTVRNLPQLS